MILASVAVGIPIVVSICLFWYTALLETDASSLEGYL